MDRMFQFYDSALIFSKKFVCNSVQRCEIRIRCLNMFIAMKRKANVRRFVFYSSYSKRLICKRIINTSLLFIFVVNDYIKYTQNNHKFYVIK